MILKRRTSVPDSGSLNPVAQVAAPASPTVVGGTQGLTSAEAAHQLVKFGPNLLETGGGFRLLRTGLGLLSEEPSNPHVDA
jgi:cation transport ATPase-like protein